MYLIRNLKTTPFDRCSSFTALITYIGDHHILDGIQLVKYFSPRIG